MKTRIYCFNFLLYTRISLLQHLIKWMYQKGKKEMKNNSSLDTEISYSNMSSNHLPYVIMSIKDDIAHSYILKCFEINLFNI